MEMSILQITILFFIAFLLAVITVYMWYMAVTTSPRHELKKRLRRLAIDFEDRRFPEELRVEILREMSRLDKMLFRIAPLQTLDRMIDKAGLKVDVKLYVFIIVTSAVVFFFLGMFAGRGMFVPFLLAPLGAIMPIIFLNIMKGRRLARFTEQFPDALDMVSRSLRAGHSFTTAMQLVGSELGDPVGTLFKNAYDEQALGVSTREAIAHMTDRIDSIDLRFFVIAINVHREIGGNLGEILERLAKTIRERMTVKRQVRVYSAQARLSGYILAVVPLVLAALFYFTTPGYVEELVESTTGIYSIVFAVAAQIVGFLVIRRIVNIRI